MAVLYISVRSDDLPFKDITTLEVAEISKEVSCVNIEQDNHEKEVCSPYPIPGTTLILERLAAYEGPFLEDLSDAEVVNILAVHLYNAGSADILYTELEVEVANKVFTFIAERIPSGKAILVLENNRESYTQLSIEKVRCCEIVYAEQSAWESCVKIQEIDMGTLSVTNTCDKALCDISLFYKSWLASPEIYVGGITYRVEIPSLEAGETVWVYPYHYAGGYSKVVSVEFELNE